jgi:Sec-independent protein secretion pathway component TatC
MVTSLTDSPGAGTFISIAIEFFAALPSKVRQTIRFVKVGLKKPSNKLTSYIKSKALNVPRKH